MTDAARCRKLQHMQETGATDIGPRSWQEVAKERGISLRILGELIGRPHSTMLAYSSRKRPLPEDLRWKISRVLGEDVQ